MVVEIGDAPGDLSGRIHVRISPGLKVKIKQFDTAFSSIVREVLEFAGELHTLGIDPGAFLGEAIGQAREQVGKKKTGIHIHIKIIEK